MYVCMYAYDNAVVIGSAMIAFGLITAVALLFSKHRQLQMELWPLVRETLFYLAGK